ncbi:Alpha/Beta hydrolase protein [Chaetomium fimeti]|uniref:Alpha/Beta hydrolase protein n=1 Tax=Chaetomium fimeti TaxID=1854472 RepID=A0AAE0HBH9_9PEZI|nr:Alpha/Beta hydrolase protein [Chaetomium fimeti]
MIDHVLGRPSVKSRRLQVLAVVAFWSAYLARGNKHGPPVLRWMSQLLSKYLTAWQTVVITMIYLYGARNFSTLVGLASPDPLSNMYDATYFRATWVLTALDAGFWTAMKISNKTLRDLASIAFSVFYMIAAEQADEKVRKVRGNITVEHMRVSWNKGSQSPYLRFLQKLVSPQFTKWPPRQVRIPRPAASDYKEPVSAWLYFDGPLSKLKKHNRIILDIPGGGFVAMNPRCNDDKLFAWAGKTGLPVLSLDYKKAPEYPYPYALNECYDVYTTIIKSRGQCIGLSGDEIPKVVITGDSAGGTLATSTTLMIIESGSSPVRRFQGQTDLPVPDGLILFYPALDMNIGSWMSDEQMALIKDRRMRGTNKRIVQRKRSQYNDLVGTPHGSDDEDDATPSSNPRSKSRSSAEIEDQQGTAVISPTHVRDPAPEYANLGPTTWSNVHQGPPAPASPAATTATPPTPSTQPGASHRPEPMRTRLATSSMISYFNDRVLTPEMMRAMIILYVGPHNRPDFSQDYLLSPILAPDVLLSRFPKTYFLTGERDPLVDDTIIFAGRLRRVKAAAMASGGQRLEYQDSDALTEGFDEKAVAEVALIPGISHGFLQFPSVYPPAWKLIDQSAGWAEELFADAERKEGEGLWEERGRQMERAFEGGNGSASVEEQSNADGRHHFRRESSGDEDQPLEMMSMTRLKAKSIKETAATHANEDGDGKGERGEGAKGAHNSVRKPNGLSNGHDQSPVGSEDRDADASPYQAPRLGPGNGRDVYRNKKPGRRARTKMGDDKSLVKLASTEDLLGRRMHGLAGGLTGLQDDPE